ncbi:MAG: pilus assembly protein N-terminal domain-containing protein [Burkholderiaceae bacterium]|jgi:hypothetical protein|nr:pilus assembly protein N-terminal domain-containing protein [Burkholderiaceae bacterium]
MRKLLNIFGGFLLLLLVSCGGGGGYSGEQGPTTKLRMTPVIDEITMAAGTYADVARISQGVRPYYVMTTQGAIEPQLLSDGTLRLIAHGPTTEEAEITIQDSTVGQDSIKFKASAVRIPLNSSVGGTVNIEPLESKTITVTGGIKPYVNAYSEDESVATITGHNGVYTITGKKPGAVTVHVVDSAGTTLDIAVNVKMTDLAVSPSISGTVVAPGVINFVITGGIGAYHVSVVDPAVADAAITGNDLSVTVKTAGTTKLVVTDDLGNQIIVDITGTTAASLAVSPSSQKVCSGVAGSYTFKITGGTAPYTASVSGAPFNVEPVDANGEFVVQMASTSIVSTTSTYSITVVDKSGAVRNVPFTIEIGTTACP